MDVKSLPTDNLYKFIAIFCIALIFTSAYAFVNVYDTFSKNYQNNQISIMELEAKTDLKDLEKKKLKFFQNRLELIDSDKGFLMGTCLWILIFSIFGAIMGFRSWRKNLQIYLDMQIQYETTLLRFQVETANKKINKDT
ncbi:hypothetical protein HJP15_09750 [Pseudoalteromonas sp. NEC-BIFX-2020_002]|uniref:hypothetical protein n=1 Tax=Pseudoalteromonas sp. NEC-BIFX-2020_002 TaxID=2732353 RepID=UPI0014772967|nr:hypothetical protein [Pseudoalteromonas sp. NEC-BIFX-2020_002]NNG43195.1 hypothetical protein [Pseudoalteromonas sp. NEC-BIFX-2020_002]